MNIEKNINPSTNTKMTDGIYERFLELCAEGGTVAEFCLQERISRTTFYTWAEKYPHMAEARKMGKDWAEGWWIRQARQHLITHSSKEEGSTRFDASLYKFYMGGRFGHTADKDADERLERLEGIVSQMDFRPKTQWAEEAECEPQEIKNE